ncbi:MAG TPA: hypothetical protein IAB23_12955 [Candidatus Scybalocola faecavium]|nr:hypothetical protein [Candidatus Scybalocola faecavium]
MRKYNSRLMRLLYYGRSFRTNIYLRWISITFYYIGQVLKLTIARLPWLIRRY